MSFFWPTTLNPDPGALARFGRVLHWLGIITGLGCCALGLVIVSMVEDPDYSEFLPTCAGLLLFFAQGGRGLRHPRRRVAAEPSRATCEGRFRPSEK
jgi:hypothetical protein